MATSSWQNLGPTALASDPGGFQSYGAVTGRATSVAVDQNDSTGNTIYIGGAFGGIWKSGNATAGPAVSWTPLIDSQPTLAIGTIALKPDTTGSTTVILAGTGEPDDSGDSYYGLGILRSADSGATWQLISSDTLGHTFKGLGFAKIAFNTLAGNTSQVVAAASNATNGASLDANAGAPAFPSLYYSTDAGLTWTPGFVSDDGVNAISPTSATDVVFDRFNGKFYAVVRNHGLYSSADGGKTWQRLSAQPGPGLSAAACPSNTQDSCRLFRGHLAVQPVTGELYAAYMFFDSAGSEALQGIFRSTDGGKSWPVELGQNGYLNCGDSSGCGASQSRYNFYLHAVPRGAGTDLYLGGINIYRCNLPNAAAAVCSWANLTHVYGCGNPIAAPSHVHPDQHGMAFVTAYTSVLYFVNDGGVYGSLNGAAVDGTCNAANANSWQNLNANIGAMTEFVWLSQDTSDSGILMGGTQDNGSPALANGNWSNVNTGDGGYNEIDPSDSGIWYTSHFDLSIQRCASGAGCNPEQFSTVITNQSTDGDHSAFYPPFMLDPLDPRKVIVGTCRVWRGQSDGNGWPGAADANALSFNFTSNTGEACTADSDTSVISALAAGGPPAPSGASSVIYAGRVDGHIFVSTAAESGPASFSDRSFDQFSGSFKVSAIAVDRNDATGKTAVAARMGFGVGHVWRTTDAGRSWADITGGLPDAPANSLLVDPADSQHIIVGTDVGVFETHDTGAAWAEVGSGMPSVPATRLLLLDAPGMRSLRASTYGRGIWEIAVPPAPFFVLQLASGSTGSASIGSSQSATYALSLTSNNGFTGTVQLTCSGAPAGAMCNINPSSASVTPATNNLPVTVTLTMPAQARVRPVLFRTWPFVYAAIFGGVLLGAARKSRRAAGMAVMLLIIGSLSSCGGSGGHVASTNQNPAVILPAAGSSTIIVTAISGARVRSVALNLTVN